MHQWTAWTPLQSFTKLNEIKSALSDCLSHIELLAYSFKIDQSFSKWANAIRHALEFDIQDLERELVVLVNKGKINDDVLSALSDQELHTLMNVLQTVSFALEALERRRL